MRPRPRPRKTPVHRPRLGASPPRFNEAAAAAAENRVPVGGMSLRWLCFNEAAAAAAENLAAKTAPISDLLLQ